MKVTMEQGSFEDMPDGSHGADALEHAVPSPPTRKRRAMVRGMMSGAKGKRQQALSPIEVVTPPAAAAAEQRAESATNIHVFELIRNAVQARRALSRPERQ